jgi:hypothetical protein
MNHNLHIKMYSAVRLLLGLSLNEQRKKKAQDTMSSLLILFCPLPLSHRGRYVEANETGIYQNYQNGAVNKQLTNDGREGIVRHRVPVNKLMCDIED